MWYVRSVGVVPLVSVLLLQPVWAQADSTRPWWDDWPRIVETGDLVTAVNHHASIAMVDVQRDPGWGIFGQMHSVNDAKMQAFHDEGMKTIAYYETFGQSYCYIAELGPWNEVDLTPILHSHWNWYLYDGGPIGWVGVHNWWDDADFARPYTLIHPRYGGPPARYPDGAIASGYDGPDTDPRNSRIFDACASKTIYGDVSYEYSPPIDPATQEPVGEMPGLVLVNGDYCGLFYFQKDSACPHWADYTYASTLLAGDHDLDGMWTDNYSPWDSFGRPPLQRAFGEWSVARFRDYLAGKYTPEELADMGIEDVSTFDVRQALRQQVVDWGGNDANMSDAKWKDARWLDHQLWHDYIIHKRQVGTEALTTYYNTVKQAASDGGKDEFFITGNDVPGYNLGWTRGELDMVSTEVSVGWSLDGGPYGFGLPPAGRLSPKYKLAREHAKSRFVNVWLYKDGPGAALAQPGLSDVMYYEMLANHTLPMFHPANSRVAGTEANNAAFFAFVEDAAPVFGGRVPVEEIGLYYSSSSVLAFFTPYDYYRHSEQPHQFSFYGWGTALGELHYQYRAVPEWRLEEMLPRLRMLVVGNAEVFTPEDVAGVLEPWVQAGGLLIVTGNSGLRLGEEGSFQRNVAGLSLAPLTGVADYSFAPAQNIRSVGSGSVFYLRDNIGMAYFLNRTERSTLLPAFADAMAAASAQETAPWLVEADSVPTTVEINGFQDRTEGRLFIDLNNMDVDTVTDSVTPTPTLEFTVNPPLWMRGLDFTVSTVSPHTAPQVDVAVNKTGALNVSVAPLTLYVSIVLQADMSGAVPGDVNFDRVVNAQDVQLAINAALGFDIWPYEPDINGDGAVNAVDVQLVINAALGMDISGSI